MTTIPLKTIFAPTDNYDDEIKKLVLHLPSNSDNFLKHGICLVMGDFNAMGGGDNREEKAMGKHGFCCQNQNGERLIELCLVSRILIGRTLLQYKVVHKVKWNSLERVTRNQAESSVCWKNI